MSKHFLVNPYVGESDREVIKAIRKHDELKLHLGDRISDEQSKRQIAEEDNLVHIQDRIVVKVDMLSKNYHLFEDGTKFRIERQFNQFNRRIAQPVNCIVISGEGIPKNAEILVSHNALHESNRINDYKNNFESEESDRVRYFSIPDYECFAWREGGGEWNPIPPFEFALMVFKPYEGVLEGIEPTEIKDTLYVTSGDLKGNVVKTLKGCAYVVIYQDTNGRENYLLRFRPHGCEKTKREEEAIAILHNETELVNSGKLFVGYDTKNCKQKYDRFR